MTQSGSERRKWKRHPISLLVRLVFPSRGIRGVQELRLRLVDVSEGGAALYCGDIKTMPDFFYIDFIDFNIGLVNTYAVGRTEDILHCRFSRELSSSQLQLVLSSGSAYAERSLPPITSNPGRGSRTVFGRTGE